MDNLNYNGGTYASTKAGLGAGTTSTTTTANTTQYAIKGKAFSAAAASNVATPVLDATTGLAFVGVPKNFGSVFVFGFDANGALKVSQGAVTALDSSGSFIQAPLLPTVPDTVAPFAYLVIKAGSTASTWVMGAGYMAAATGITYTFVDVQTLPARPQIL